MLLLPRLLLQAESSPASQAMFDLNPLWVPMYRRFCVGGTTLVQPIHRITEIAASDEDP